jgi:hypothetical protein
MTILEGSAIAVMCFLTVFLTLGGLYVLIKMLSTLLSAFSRESKGE